MNCENNSNFSVDITVQLSSIYELGKCYLSISDTIYVLTILNEELFVRSSQRSLTIFDYGMLKDSGAWPALTRIDSTI